MALDRETRELNDAVLERGSPEEILPDELFRWKSMAHHYIRGEHPQEAKDRVEAVWLKGENRPMWHEVRKLPDLRGSLPRSTRPPTIEGIRVEDVQLDRRKLEKTGAIPEDTDFG
jgi:hypothetical protein